VSRAPLALAKCASGIAGFDEITGCGKTQLAVEFITRGARDFNEPGVFRSFEETEEELKSNVSSLGFDLDAI
jgi:circadian clock protein KaiC